MNKLSEQFAHSLGKSLNSSEDEIQVFAYSTEILLLVLTTTALVTILAGLLDSLPLTLVFLAAFAPLRCFGGGAHLSSGPRCVLTSTALFVGLGWLAYTPATGGLLWSLATLLALSGPYVIVKWVPAGTENHTITDVHIRRRQKVRTGLLGLIGLLVLTVLIAYGFYPQAMAVVLGAAAALALISPPGYILAGAADHIFDILDARR